MGEESKGIGEEENKESGVEESKELDVEKTLNELRELTARAALQNEIRFYSAIDPVFLYKYRSIVYLYYGKEPRVYGKKLLALVEEAKERRVRLFEGITRAKALKGKKSVKEYDKVLNAREKELMKARKEWLALVDAEKRREKDIDFTAMGKVFGKTSGVEE